MQEWVLVEGQQKRPVYEGFDAKTEGKKGVAH